ncbi:hypothetical protein OIU76_001152, partial [Salix suchowensis]
MDSTIAQYSSLLTTSMPVATLSILLPNSSLMQPTPGLSMKPLPRFFASSMAAASVPVLPSL